MTKITGKEVKARAVKFLEREEKVLFHCIDTVEFEGQEIIGGLGEGFEAWQVGNIYIFRTAEGFIDTRTTKQGVLNSWII